MKKENPLKKYTIMAAFIFTICIGCREENADPAAPTPLGVGSAILDTEIYPTNFAYAWDLGKYSNSTTEDFSLDISDGSSGEIYHSKETTTIINFNMNSSDADKIAEGLYTYSAGTAHAAFTFENVWMHIHLIYEDGELTGGDGYDDVKTGVVKVSYPNGKVKLEYAISFEDDVELTGTYEGKLVYYDFDWIKKLKK